MSQITCAIIIVMCLVYVVAKEIPHDHQIVSRFTSNVIVKHTTDHTIIARGKAWFDFEKRLFQMNLMHLNEDKKVVYLTLMTKEAPGVS
jgi:hypothetical protein